MERENEKTSPSGVKKKSSWPDFSSLVRRFFETNQESAASKPLRPEPGLYVVATPIGNLGDISLRALWLLSQADLVLCEDTRVTGALLRAYGLQKPLLSCHDHNESARVQEVLSRLANNEILAFVSDAGTPLLSDPGFRLVQACRAAERPVFALPGASALLTALSCAGLPTDRFLFAGFLPPKRAARKKEIETLSSCAATIVFYEAPQRLADCLADLAEVFGSERRGAVARELTKFYEEVRPATLGELASHYAQAETPKGEIVLLVAPAEKTARALSPEDLDGLLKKAMATMSLKDAVAAVTEATGAKKSDLYERALKLK